MLWLSYGLALKIMFNFKSNKSFCEISWANGALHIFPKRPHRWPFGNHYYGYYDMIRAHYYGLGPILLLIILKN